MKLITFGTLLTLLVSTSSFAGYDSASSLVCKNDKYKLTLKFAGSLFGSDNIKLSERGVFGKTIINEAHYRNYDSGDIYAVEEMAREENPISNESFMPVYQSENSVFVYSVTNGTYATDRGERDTIYFQLKDGEEILKFDIDTQCKK